MSDNGGSVFCADCIRTLSLSSHSCLATQSILSDRALDWQTGGTSLKTQKVIFC